MANTPQSNPRQARPQGTQQSPAKQSAAPADDLVSRNVAKADQILSERASFHEREEQIAKAQERLDLVTQLCKNELAQQTEQLQKDRADHNQRHNIIAVPKQIEPPQQGADTPTSDSSQPASASQLTLSDEDYDKRKALSKRLDTYAGTPDDERPDVAHLCEDEGIEFKNLDELRQQLGMQKGAALTYQSVRQAVNTQLRSRYMSEDDIKAEAAANAQQPNTDARTIHLFGGWGRAKQVGDKKVI